MKKNNAIVVCILVLVAAIQVSCGTNPAVEERKVDSSKPELIAAPDAATTATLTAQFNGLEKVFNNQNWMIIQNKDTSFLYLSRLNKFFAISHSYKMIKGDSAELRMDTVQLSKDNKIVWNWKGQKLSLNAATDNTNSWVGDTTKIDFVKMDDANLIQTINGKDKIKMTKTLTLSTFLVRSFYDYQHGTKLAFEPEKKDKR